MRYNFLSAKKAKKKKIKTFSDFVFASFTEKNLYWPFFLLLLFRCGGQGDLLSGSLSVFLYWASRHSECPDPGAGVIAGWASARLARACAAQAFSQHGRATTTSDLIDQIESAFSRLYESETCLWWFIIGNWEQPLLLYTNGEKGHLFSGKALYMWKVDRIFKWSGNFIKHFRM